MVHQFLLCRFLPLNWQQEFSCFANCSATETVSGLANGDYYVYAKYYTSAYQLICQEVQTITVGGGGCDDADNDGTCDADDCQPNNHAFPATPGSSCNDGNPNTTNDMVTADGCGCEGTPISGCDNVSNGGQIGSDQTVCAGDAAATLTNVSSATGGSGAIEYIWLSSTSDCPTSLNQTIAGATSATYNPGTLSTTTYFVRCSRRAGCSDWTVGESNCVTVTVDNSPNCGGGGGDPDCADISITTGTGSITVSGLDGAPVSSLQIFNSAWQQEFSCFANCSATETVNLPAGTYQVYAKYYTAAYVLVCQEAQTITVTGGGCPDADNDGTCDADDCQPNNPAFPATPGTSCNDGNPNTTNDVVTADGCGCEGTPVSGCDNVNNGGQIGSDQTVCAGDAAATLTNVSAPTGGSGAIEYIWLSSTSSCPTNLNQTIAGATSATYNPGTLSTTTYFVRCSRRAGCSDWTVGESDCVTVTVDNSPNCGGGGPDCNDISITTEPGKIIVSGLDGAPVTSLQIFNSSWQQEFSCFADCGAMEMVDLPAGDYYVYAKYYTAAYALICQANPTITVEGGGCTDNDNDGICAADDCDDNNPNLPATPGTSCNDGNPNTINDVIQSDGCLCEGTFDACATAGGDNDNDGVCAADDCDDNNPNLPAAPGTACNDGDANTENDVITADGCGCQGTPVSCPDADNDGICDVDDCQPNNPAFPAAPGTACNDGDANTVDDVIQNDGCSCVGIIAPICEITRTGSNADECSINVSFGIFIAGSGHYPVSQTTLTEYSNGTALLEGYVSGLGNMYINFTGRSTNFSPLFNSCYTTSTSDWYYYSSFSGTIGSLTLQGDTNHPFQVGSGANNHNQNSYGGSGWFVTGSGQNGDINLRLTGDTNTLQFDSNCEGSNLVAVTDNDLGFQVNQLEEYTEMGKTQSTDLIDFTLFPNPANDYVKIDLETLIGNEVDIHFYNNLGQRVKAVHLDEVYNKYYQIDINDLQNGHYNVWMQVPGKRPVTKALVIGKF